MKIRPRAFCILRRTNWQSLHIHAKESNHGKQIL